MTETENRRDLHDIAQLAEVATQALDDEREDAYHRAIVELHTHAAACLHRAGAGLEQARIDRALAPGRRQRAEAEAREHFQAPARDERGSALAGAIATLACFVAVVVMALVLLDGWLAQAGAVEKPRGHGCRNAQHCKPVKPPKATPTPTQAPEPVPCPNLCTPTDLTTAWPSTVPPVVIVQTFPEPMSP